VAISVPRQSSTPGRLDISAVVARWDESSDLAKFGVGYLLYVPTLITGFFGMSVPCSGFGQKAGLVAATVVMAMAGLVLYLVFRHRDWQ
jgi:ABC-type phosphate transport system permease subunit